MNESQYYSRVNYKLSLTGMLLGAALLFQFLSKFMPLIPTLMDINLSLIFIIPIFFVTDYKYGIIALFLRAVIGPAIGKGYAPQELLGHFILLLDALVFIHLLLFFKKIKFFNNKWGMIISIFIATIISTLLMTALNGLLFVPWYSYIYLGTFDHTISTAFGLNNYWAIIFAVYVTGNLINYGLSAIVLVPILKLIKPKLK